MLNSNYLHLDGGGIFNEVDYYHWLLHLVCADSEPYINYLLLLQTLHKKDYIWTNSNDMNRVQDAYSLRKEYMQNFFRVCNELSLSPQARAKMGIMAAGKSAKKNDLIFQIFGDDSQE